MTSDLDIANFLSIFKTLRGAITPSNGTLPFYHTLTKFLPGSCRTKPDISRSNRAPISSDEETPSKVSTSASSCLGSSICDALGACLQVLLRALRVHME